MRRTVVLAVFGLLAITPAVHAAKPQAPGAPGAIHTWAPADKHGYGTSHEGSPVAFTLRQAMLSEVYWPDLSTPSFRGLQFAVVDGKEVTRETVDDDPRHIERVSPGVTASVDALDGTLAYRQVTRTSRWQLTKTWITDPARDSGSVELLTGLPGSGKSSYLIERVNEARAAGSVVDDRRRPFAGAGRPDLPPHLLAAADQRGRSPLMVISA